jgi:hypothetical protein
MMVGMWLGASLGRCAWQIGISMRKLSAARLLLVCHADMSMANARCSGGCIALHCIVHILAPFAENVFKTDSQKQSMKGYGFADCCKLYGKGYADHVPAACPLNRQRQGTAIANSIAITSRWSDRVAGTARCLCVSCAGCSSRANSPMTPSSRGSATRPWTCLVYKASHNVHALFLISVDGMRNEDTAASLVLARSP